MKKVFSWMNDGNKFSIPCLDEISMDTYLQLQKAELVARKNIMKEFDVTHEDIQKDEPLQSYLADEINAERVSILFNLIDDNVTTDMVKQHMKHEDIVEIIIHFFKLDELKDEVEKKKTEEQSKNE
jgi:hypothetical protein